MSNEIAKVTEAPKEVSAGFGTTSAFEFMQRQATMLASSDLVPEQFSIIKAKDAQDKQRKIANTMIALEMANRIGASPLAVLQNIYIVHGKPSWSSTFIIAAINGCGRFTAMRFEMTGEGDKRTCIAVATEKQTGERIESPPISIDMAKKEGWFSKSGSKWLNMPELMLRYRAATLFGRLYAPEILMGMRTVEELEDIEDAIVTDKATAKDVMDRFKKVEPVAEEVEIPMPEEEKAEAKPESDDDGFPDPPQVCPECHGKNGKHSESCPVAEPE
jgi:hypothetical protein